VFSHCLTRLLPYPLCIFQIPLLQNFKSQYSKIKNIFFSTYLGYGMWPVHQDKNLTHQPTIASVVSHGVWCFVKFCFSFCLFEVSWEKTNRKGWNYQKKSRLHNLFSSQRMHFWSGLLLPVTTCVICCI
jgi:hypothetical protein